MSKKLVQKPLFHLFSTSNAIRTDKITGNAATRRAFPPTALTGFGMPIVAISAMAPSRTMMPRLGLANFIQIKL